MSAREIRLLRTKFIAVSMASVFLAMLFIAATVSSATFLISRLSVNRTLEILIDSAEELDAPERSFRFTFQELFSPDYQRNAWFVLSYDEDGTLVSFHTNSQDSGEVESVQEAGQTLLTGRRSNGLYRGYYFKRASTDGDGQRLAFLDSSMIISSTLRTVYLALILCSLGLVLTYFLMRKLSGRMVRHEIENALRQKQFITNASHELKTPLAVIRANTEMVELSQGESEWTQSTLRQVDRLSGLIGNLVMIARTQEQEDRSDLREIDAAKAVNESVDPYELLASQSGLTILRDIDPSVRLPADESTLRQLTAILIDNAVKYCDEKGTISVSLSRPRGGGLVLEVGNDYAAGENVDYMRFFDRFYREDSSHNIDKGGYGIGLSIAESICRQYGGSISASWKDGAISFRCVMR